MKTPTYCTLNEKANVFNQIIIETFDDLKNWLNAVVGNDLIFRGLPEAKYMLFNSLQRYWIENDMPSDMRMFNDFIHLQIDKFKNQNNGLINSYFKNLNLKYPEYGILSMMQHYEGHTPFIDFTNNPLIALFFGTKKRMVYPNLNIIDNYFTIYSIKRSLTDTPSVRFKEILVLNSTNLEKPNEYKDIINVIRNEETSLIGLMNKWKFGSVQDYENSLYKFGIMTNLNIIKQEGLFIFNYHPTKTLDESIVDFISTNLIPKGVENHIKIFQNLLKITSVEINKKLIPDIRKFLSKNNIKKSEIFPNIKRMIVKAEKETKKMLFAPI